MAVNKKGQKALIRSPKFQLQKIVQHLDYGRVSPAHQGKQDNIGVKALRETM